MARGPDPLTSFAPYRALVLGWHGSRERHLRAIGRHHASRGADVIARAPRTFRAMGAPGGWEREAAPIAAEILARDPRPMVIHAFSNAGFWSARAILDALGERAKLVGTILDSAPGFPEQPSFRFTARYAGRAMLPSLLEALGQRPALTHPLLTPPVSAFLGAWHLLARGQVRFMASSQARMVELHHGLPLLAIYGGADELVPARYVEAFLDRGELAGMSIERLFFPDGLHVRHFVAHRAAYLGAIDRLLGRCVPRA